MKYMGSKRKIAKYILPIILKDKKLNQYYVEPFVGGCNIIDKVKGLRIGNDNNKYLIAMWNGLKNGFDQPNITRNLYNLARDCYNKNNNELSDFQIGYIGWMGSFNGRFFDGGFSGTHGNRNYIDEQVRNTNRQIQSISGIEFKYGDYFTLAIPDNSIIYCDPPYDGTKKYSTSTDFDYNFFWNWCREQKQKGHQIFISEYSAPSDFKCVWQMEVTNSMNTTLTYKPIEKLFTL